jgi:hypothetical protein
LPVFAYFCLYFAIFFRRQAPGPHYHGSLWQNRPQGTQKTAFFSKNGPPALFFYAISMQKTEKLTLKTPENSKNACKMALFRLFCCFFGPFWRILTLFCG